MHGVPARGRTVPGEPMRDISLIVIHCSATPPEQDIGAAEIREWHMNGNGWSDIGYHYVVRRSGVIETGRPLERAGAHASGHNEDSIGVCLVGGLDAERDPDANYTHRQWTSLLDLVDELAARWPRAKILGHRDLPDVAKACPCFDARAWAARNDR